MLFMHPAIFLDRDGVIIENREQYVRSWPDVTFYPESLLALSKISRSPYKIVIVTNQSAVGRGLISLEDAEGINGRIREVIQEAGGRIDGIFLCPHRPEDGCTCRKPQPGLILRAARELSLDLSQSILIGDALDDLRAGQAANLPRTILVLTGRGKAQSSLAAARSLAPFEVFDSLLAAIQHLLLSVPKPDRPSGH